jgi:type IV pilus assembly protein PilZ
MTSRKTPSQSKGTNKSRKTAPSGDLKPSVETASSEASTDNKTVDLASAKEGRSGRRVPIQLLVDYKSGGSYLFDFCKDLGTGGVFIQTDKPLPTGSTIDLTFTIPDSKETLVTRGTVIWVQAPVATKEDLVAGMGIQFSGFSGEQRSMLENFVQRYHGDKRLKGPPSPKRAI